MRLREVLVPGQYGVYRRTYTDSMRNRVCCYVAINQEPFARLGTSCALVGSGQEYALLRQLGQEFRENVTSEGAMQLPRYYDKPFIMDPKKIPGLELLNEVSDVVFRRCLVLNTRKVNIAKESLDEKERTSFEEGYMFGLM